ncbi:GNAT family N-acetyltransferase [Fredinandcohnia sp. QZ13]|uniref:aminoglycoside 6'-N-acetyltransferase n=1 Tax=Fredinandcohnia sp. QZ13 TaxID=3073144 RepID=UPI00285322E0|nr:aminoglycoside 6'-N-acetyltransferase [Fredinandcohnia sp. QZ13]MDR4887314.1 GNAT family N-acetyltransferase [Fredinandcohnia sp. QZ13]
MEIVKATVEDVHDIVSLALQLWPENVESVFTMEFTELIHDKKAVIFLAKEENEAIGFAQCQLRVDYVEGTESSPVGYLEGIFVKEEHRRKGVAKQLLSSCEKWAKHKDCLEFASDVELENDKSLNFHLKNGFQEANRIICLTKKL